MNIYSQLKNNINNDNKIITINLKKDHLLNITNQTNQNDIIKINQRINNGYYNKIITI
jgi:hypothetical protein